MFLIYSTGGDDYRCSREEILTELSRYPLSVIERVQRTHGKELASRGCDEFPSIGEIALIIYFDEKGLTDNYMHVQSDEFVSDEAVFQFVREAGLIEVMEEKPRLLS